MSGSKFYRDLIILLIIGIAGVYCISHFYLEQSVPTSFWLSLTFIVITTIVIHRVLLDANTKRPQLFVAYFMGTLTGKLFLSAMILLVVGMVDRPHLKFTAVAYFAFYALLTVVELKHLLPLVRSENH